MTASHLASLRQVTDVTSADFRCYNTALNLPAQTATVAAGSSIGFMANGPVYHPGVRVQLLMSNTKFTGRI